ncbi:WxL domain-containing protein [Lentilactobacillus senioris]|uniref:WxL domain-containing protein n=1 Tax=Lentilactobacillus senioris TaxID=931534 RepID=UPI0022800A22|nr:WxL domain-containing protein [Lentilactobacillus senioris]MCY9807403.1 WxL domain-containing protein [Lentilactobacillus senioris]
MKKRITTIVLLIIGSLFIPMMTVKAADGSLNTQAVFQVNGKLLSLSKTPSFHFGEVNLSEVAKGNDRIQLQSGKDNQLQVTNYDPDVAQWSVDVQATDFKDDKGKVLSGAQLSLTPDQATNDENQTDIQSMNVVDIIGSSATILLGQALGTTSVSFDQSKNAVLDLSNVDTNAIDEDDTYTSTVQWTLSSQAKAPAASTY